MVQALYKSGKIIDYYNDFDERYEWWLVWGDKSTLMTFNFIDFDDTDSSTNLEDNDLEGYDFTDEEVESFTQRLNSGFNCGF